MKQEPRVKAGISIDGKLAKEADALAREMGVTRSGLYAMALREFIRRRESADLLEKLNDAYREPDPEDELLLRSIKHHSRRLLDEEER
jgi:antitoxin component of RelBE/YafQ-DinJ toxin-antitoxin module